MGLKVWKSAAASELKVNSHEEWAKTPKERCQNLESDFDLFIANSLKVVHFANTANLQWGWNHFESNWSLSLGPCWLLGDDGDSNLHVQKLQSLYIISLQIACCWE